MSVEKTGTAEQRTTVTSKADIGELEVKRQYTIYILRKIGPKKSLDFMRLLQRGQIESSERDLTLSRP